MRSSWFLRLLTGAWALQLAGCPFFFDQNICGDDDIDLGEECDDGNNNADDGCDEFCQVEVQGFCGDGELQAQFEECDDGNTQNGDGCDQNCLSENNGFCGDFFVDPGEDCDDGNQNNGDGCDAFCQFENNVACGNLVVEQGEGCDDGNLSNGDGCSFLCQVEGDVTFSYVLLEPDGNGGIAATPGCTVTIAGNDVTVVNVRFMVGNDNNNDGVVQDNEIIQESSVPCNQEDLDNNGTIDAGELGVYISAFSSGFFDLFAIEFLDANSDPILWETFDTTVEAQRFSFGSGIGLNIAPTQGVFITFDSDPQLLPQLDQELQAFFGF